MHHIVHGRCQTLPLVRQGRDWGRRVWGTCNACGALLVKKLQKRLWKEILPCLYSPLVKKRPWWAVGPAFPFGLSAGGMSCDLRPGHPQGHPARSRSFAVCWQDPFCPLPKALDRNTLQLPRLHVLREMKCESAFDICTCNSNTMGMNRTIALQPQREHAHVLQGSGAPQGQEKVITLVNFSVFMCTTLWC